ncbi:hypothetical protein RvY_07840 [Ramazzottius varieornatus]|uniref:guanylate cyclase n=1 Tax=Ramazzottius varieornatus TaxID=947166 RepID=A0A1D1V6J4_RAMVA|nr:hypothetical protein RvY_07840 [Ramazzottius varieornatus]
MAWAVRNYSNITGQTTVGADDLANWMGQIMSGTTEGSITILNGIQGSFGIATPSGDLRENTCIMAMMDLNLGAYLTYLRYDGVLNLTSYVNASYSWISTDGTFPANEPYCGFTGDADVCRVISDTTTTITTAVVIPLVLLTCAVVAYMSRRRYKLSQLDDSWLAQLKELKVVDPNKGIDDKGGPTDQQATTDEKAEGKFSMGGNSLNASNNSAIPTAFSVGYWKSVPYTVRWTKKRFLKASAKIALEVRAVSAIRNDNIAELRGGCLEKASVLLLYDYCSRGSLEESVNDMSSKFEWPLRFSYINDVIRAMHYIHTSSIKLHGRLSSACCFIDSRFTLKVADVGLPSFFNMNLAEFWSQKRRPDFYYRQFWVAPEVLREQENRVEEVVKVTTKEQDIYSFGIIMQEIILHSPPYAMYGDDYTDERIYNAIVKEGPPGMKAFRPMLDETAGHIDIIKICERCWAEIPQDRPSFNQIRVVMKEVTKLLGMGDRLNIMETLIQQMEEHTATLEGMIEEKDTLIQQEKSRADALLFSNLPSTITDALTRGSTLDPVYLDLCSILIIDIMNFDILTAQCSAEETAQLLADVHGTYFEEASKFDCWMMETLTQKITVS